MTLPNEPTLQKLQFYVTSGHTCGYLPGKMSQSLVALPQHLINTSIYNNLIQQGFRRSGQFAYKSHCEHCHECIPVRVPLQKFQPNRSQKRAYKQHLNLTTKILPIAFDEAHFQLYMAYQRARHLDEGSNKEASEEGDVEQYKSFICESNVESVMVEFRENEQLRMVSVIDIVQDGISAVYTFYDASEAKASFGDPIRRASYGDLIRRASYGTYNVLWQIEWAKSLNLPYLYLGYWIKDSQKMAYKQNFKPLEKLQNGEWR